MIRAFDPGNQTSAAVVHAIKQRQRLVDLEAKAVDAMFEAIDSADIEQGVLLGIAQFARKGNLHTEMIAKELGVSKFSAANQGPKKLTQVNVFAELNLDPKVKAQIEGKLLDQLNGRDVMALPPPESDDV